jgi:hypothetical protein
VIDGVRSWLSPTTITPSTLRRRSIVACSCRRPASPRASVIIIDSSISLRAASAPSVIGTAKRCAIESMMIRPTVPLRPLMRLRAIGLGV